MLKSSKRYCGSYPAVLQVLNICSVVTVLHPSRQNPEAFSSDGIDHRSSIGEEMDAPDEQHAAVICESANKSRVVPLIIRNSLQTKTGQMENCRKLQTNGSQAVEQNVF